MFSWLTRMFRRDEEEKDVGTESYIRKNKASCIVPMEYTPKNGFKSIIPIYCFIHDANRNKYYGIRHFQGYELIGWRRIPLSELSPSKYHEYGRMGMKIQKGAVEYKEGDPTRIVFGYAYNSRIGKIMAMTWNEKKGKIEPVDAETTIDVIDPMWHV